MCVIDYTFSGFVLFASTLVLLCFSFVLAVAYAGITLLMLKCIQFLRKVALDQNKIPIILHYVDPMCAVDRAMWILGLYLLFWSGYGKLVVQMIQTSYKVIVQSLGMGVTVK